MNTNNEEFIKEEKKKEKQKRFLKKEGLL